MKNKVRLPRRASDGKMVNVENETAESATQECFNPVTARAAPPDHFREAKVLAEKGRMKNEVRLPRRASDGKMVNVENETAESVTQECFNPVTARSAPPDHFREAEVLAEKGRMKSATFFDR